MTSTDWLKASFIAGAVADGVFGVLLLMPSRMGEMEFTYALGVAASLMFGWTALLIWGLQQPLERRGLLLITVCPVLVGLLATTAYHLSIGTLPSERLIMGLVMQTALVGLMGFSYWNAKGLRRDEAAS